MHRPKVLFICKRRHNSYGVSTGLYNSARFVAEALNHHSLAHAQIIEVVDGNDIDREVTKHDPQFVVLEALWATPDKLRELLAIKRHALRKWAVRLHSKTPFLANEGIAIEWIAQYPLGVTIGTNSTSLKADLISLRDRIAYQPNIYRATHHDPKPIDWCHRTLNIGCFGAVRPLKNHLEQAIAAIHFGNAHEVAIRFHVNGTRTEQRGEEVLRNLRALFRPGSKHQLVEHAWLPHHDFVRLAAKMDLGMQISLSETFNIVVADMIVHGVPVVASDEVDWLPASVTVSHPTQLRAINEKLVEAATYPVDFCKIQQNALDKHNARAIDAWYAFLSPE